MNMGRMLIQMQVSGEYPQVRITLLKAAEILLQSLRRLVCRLRSHGGIVAVSDL